jgi:hypothetical protein
MAYRERQKISQMTPKGSNISATDLIEVSTLVSGSYVTKSLTGQEVIDGVGGNFVPYTGATQDVDLDTNKLSAESIYIDGTGGNGHLHMKHQSADATATGQSTALWADTNGDIKWKNDNDYKTTLKTSDNTADRTYTFPNADCTLTPDSRTISTTAPLSGGGDLSANRTLSITKATTTTDGYLSSSDWTTFNNKQSALVSGTNIKTVQSTSIVGSGDVTITDANLSMSDITTNNVSITQHGFVPKAPNDTTKFLRGDGTWATAGGGLTVGTTPVTSGTNGRVFFQAGGVVQQDGAFNWDNTNKRLGIGANATSPSSALFIRTNLTSANDVLDIQNGQYGNPLFRIRDMSTASPIANFFFSGLIFGGNSGVTRRFDLGGFGLGASFGEFGTNAVWENNQGNIGDGQGTSVIAVSSNLFVNLQTTKKYKFEAVTGNFGIGNVGSLGARLDVRAQGALSTDIAFRVRNSADTANISEFRGNGVGIVCGISTARAVFSPYNAHGGDGFIMTTQDLAPNASPTKAAMFMTETYTNFYGSGGTQSISFAVDTTYGGTTRQWQFSNLNLNDGALYIGTGNSATNNRRMFLTDSAVLNIGKDTMGNTQSGTNQLRILNGTAPTSLATDTFALYSADITAGNAAPHFRTENGNIIKLYRETTGVAASTLVGGGGTALTDTDTFDGYTLKQIVKALRNQGLLA